MKEKLSLLEVCKLPDVQLHSKTAFFKSIVGKESAEVLKMKDHIASLSYTVKVIGVQGEEVGITSKRVPLTLKRNVQEKKQKNNFVPVDNYLPHKSFYSHALVPIHVPKQPPKEDQEPLFAISANGAIRVDSTERKTASLKTRTRSMANMRAHRAKRIPQNIDQIGRIRGVLQPENGLKKKSYSGLLKECNAFVNEKINPLLHEENPLFKKIQKIKGVYPEIAHIPVRIEKYQSRPRQSISSQSSIAKHYQDEL